MTVLISRSKSSISGLYPDWNLRFYIHVPQRMDPSDTRTWGCESETLTCHHWRETKVQIALVACWPVFINQMIFCNKSSINHFVSTTIYKTNVRHSTRPLNQTFLLKKWWTEYEKCFSVHKGSNLGSSCSFFLPIATPTAPENKIVCRQWVNKNMWAYCPVGNHDEKTSSSLTTCRRLPLLLLFISGSQQTAILLPHKGKDKFK